MILHSIDIWSSPMRRRQTSPRRTQSKKIHEIQYREMSVRFNKFPYHNLDIASLIFRIVNMLFATNE